MDMRGLRREQAAAWSHGWLRRSSAAVVRARLIAYGRIISMVSSSAYDQVWNGSMLRAWLREESFRDRRMMHQI